MFEWYRFGLALEYQITLQPQAIQVSSQRGYIGS